MVIEWGDGWIEWDYISQNFLRIEYIESQHIPDETKKVGPPSLLVHGVTYLSILFRTQRDENSGYNPETR